MSAITKPLKWFYHEFGVDAIHSTGRNAYLIIIARSCRMFAYGTNSFFLAIFFSALGFSDHSIGIFMTLTLLGDVFLGTFLTLIADRVGRRKVLLGGSVLMITSGAAFALSENFWVLLLSAIFGVIAVTGGDFGPFRSIEESVLSQLTTSTTRADVLAWYVTTSSLGSSLGSEASGRIMASLLRREGWTAVDAYHFMFWIYSAMGLVNAALVLLLTDDCELESTQSEATYTHIVQDEAEEPQQSLPARPSSPPGDSLTARLWSYVPSGLSTISAPTRSIMYNLWTLLCLDSLADGMVPYTLTNYYMDQKFSPLPSTLGDVTSIAYFLSAVGAVFAGPLARKIGLINTMVFTHVPSSAAVLLFPLPPYFWMAASLFFVRAGLNNMDQAPRTAFIAAVVKPEERTAVMGITSMLRILAAMSGPLVTGWLAESERFWIAFVVAGAFRLAYDFGLYALFVNMKVEGEEGKRGGVSGNGGRGDEEAIGMESLASIDVEDEEDEHEHTGQAQK